MKHAVLMLCLLSLFSLAACNTMKGLGQDIEHGGDKLEHAADKAQK